MINAIKIGIDGYIIKPFEYEQLNNELFKIVEKIDKFAQNEEYKKHLKNMVEQKTSELNSMISFQKYNYDKTLLSMVEMIEDRDTYTAGHSERVAHYSKLIAQEMGLEDKDCQKVYQAGILHDIGKIATPDVVLLNPQKLNDLEYKLIQEHVEVGYKLLVNIPMFEELAAIVHDHHERYDGSGYPRSLEDNEINPLAKIMSVADTFDAMTTNRIYKGRKSVSQALAELKGLKSIFYNPDVIEACVIALQNVTIDTEVNQLPHTDVEKERFSYFYNDLLTNVYNQRYLDVVLVQNSFDTKFDFLQIFQLRHFTEYNKQKGWQSGDDILKSVASVLKKCSKNVNIFRVFGDDFVFLSNGKCEISKILKSIKNVLKESVVVCETKSLNIHQSKIDSVRDLEDRVKV
jgi:putative nucleotidyltransferase with HDIG domain/diguanylate cyclase (GGDEF)-like protein